MHMGYKKRLHKSYLLTTPPTAATEEARHSFLAHTHGRALRSFSDTSTVVDITICRRQHTQSANFISRAETLSKSGPETGHYDDRPPSYPQSMQRRHIVQATFSNIS